MTVKNDLIFSFKDTLNIASGELLKPATEKAILSSKVYKEDFISNSKQYPYKVVDIEVVSNTTFATAKNYCNMGKVAVLNFANPENPGGGVQNGAMAQEECLCRSSNLYPCLCNNTIFSDFYLYHRSLHNFYYTDRIIYTQGVTVFKDDSDIPKLMPEKEWFKVDVITCAAPYMAKCQNIDKKFLEDVFKSRIKNIFESALDNGVQVLILGAFGCGAFKNPPELVSRAFHKVIVDNEYKTKFKKIVFAIKNTVNADSYRTCPNLEAFEKEFYGVSKVSFNHQPINSIADSVIKKVETSNSYSEWKIHNPYFGKHFSVLGDSISTLDGYNPHGYNVFYSGENCNRSGVRHVKDTWWGKVIEYFGGNLLVNNSWSGSRVTKLLLSNSLFPSGCSDERTSGLHINDVLPDIIIIYLGTNDWAQGALCNCEGVNLVGNGKYQSFDFAYSAMISKIKSNYPKAEIWCCTLNTTYMYSNPSFKFPLEYTGKHIEIYNSIIRKTANTQSCKLIDIYSYSVPYDSIDGSHPNAVGMNTLANMIINSIVGKKSEFYFNNDLAVEISENKTPNYYCFPNKKNLYSGVKQLSRNLLIAEKYQVINHLQKGQLFDFYLVKDKKLNTNWDAKIYFKNKNFSNKDYSLNLVYQIIKNQQTLQHRSIPRIVDVIDCNDYICVIQDHILGYTFESMVSNYGPQPVEKVVDWIKQICDTIKYVESKTSQVDYSTIEPLSVKISTGGIVLLTEICNINTLRFIPNQSCQKYKQVASSIYDNQGKTLENCITNIYGLGITMLFLLFGSDFKNIFSNYKEFVNNKCLPPKITYIISKCINPKKYKRYNSTLELLDDLNNIDKLNLRKKLF